MIRKKPFIIVLYLLLLVSHSCFAQSEDGLSVKLDITNQKLLKNDILFCKIQITNNTEMKKKIWRKIEIPDGTLRFQLKRPAEKSFKKVNVFRGFGPQGFKIPFGPQITIEAGKTYDVYSSLFVNKKGKPVFSDAGTYTLKVSIGKDKKRNEWIESDTRKLTVQKQSALDSTFIKKCPVLLKKLSLSVTIELLPRPSEIKDAKNEQLEESNIKHFLSFIEIVSNQLKNKNFNIKTLKKRNEKLRNDIGNIAAEAIEKYYRLSEGEDGNKNTNTDK